MTEILFARKTDVDSLIVSIAAANGAVRYDIAQTLTAGQQAQALANIGGAGTIVLTGDVTGSGPGAGIATTVASIAGNAVAGTTGTGNVVFSAGTPTFTAQLTINQNTVAGPSPVQAGGVNIIAGNSTIGGYAVDTFALQGSNAFRRANGTAALPTKLLSGDTIGVFSFKGYDAVTGYTVTQASIILNTAEDWNTATNRGTTFLFRTTPVGSGSQAAVMQVQASGGLSVGPTAVSTDPGAGNLLVQNFINTGGHLRVTSDLGKANSVTLSAITGLSATLVAGKTYSFIGTLYTASNVAGGIQVSLSTSTATLTNLVCEAQVTDGAAIKQQTRQSTLGTIVNFTAVTAARIDINGTITVNAAGTFALSFAQNASNAGNTTVLQGSWMKIWQVT